MSVVVSFFLFVCLSVHAEYGGSHGSRDAGQPSRNGPQVKQPESSTGKQGEEFGTRGVDISASLYPSPKFGNRGGGTQQVNAFWIQNGKYILVVNRENTAYDVGSDKVRKPRKVKAGVSIVRASDGLIMRTVSLPHSDIDLDGIYVNGLGNTVYLKDSLCKGIVQVNLSIKSISCLEKLPQTAKLLSDSTDAKGMHLNKHAKVVVEDEKLRIEDNRKRILGKYSREFQYDLPKWARLSPNQKQFFVLGYEGTIRIFDVKNR